MQTSTVLVAFLFAITSFPFLGQGSPQDTAPTGSGGQQQTAPAANQTPGAQPQQAAPTASAEASAPTAPATPAPELRPVNAELVSNLDTKTAKAGDSVVVQTKAAVKTADGTDIPKGTKLVGRVVGAQASAAGATSQIAVQFDHAELAGGQNVPIQSQIQSVGSSSASSAAADGSSAMNPVAPRGAETTSPSAAGSTPSSAAQTPGASSAQPPAAGSASVASAAPGTVVAKTGQIDIRTTSIPGVLLANNQPGQQDPRMVHASSVLLGAHKDVQLTGGTPLVIGVATNAGAAGTK